MNHLEWVKFAEEDFDYYFQLVSNEKVMEQITERAIPFIEAQENFQKILERNRKYDIFGTYKVCEGGKFIGLGHLTLNATNEEEAEIGYMIVPEHWGKGYGKTIGRQLVELAKGTNVTTLKAIIDPNNIASRKILINLGFESEKVCEIDGLPGEILSRAI